VVRLLLFASLVALSITGCSTKILLPYEESPRCVPSSEYGSCGSVRDVYKKNHINSRIER